MAEATPAIGDLEARRKAARVKRDAFQPLLDDVHDYLIPTRRRSDAEGEARVDKIFDSSPYMSAYRFAGRLHEDLWATGEDNYRLEAGPVLKAQAEGDEAKKAEIEAFEKVLGRVGKISNAAFLDGQWDQALSENCWDLLGGTAVTLAQPGEGEQFVEWTAISIAEIMLERSGNKHTGIFWSTKWSLRAIVDKWGDEFFCDKLKEIHKNDAAKEIELFQDAVWDGKKKRWIFTVWSPDNEKKPFAKPEESRTCPFLIPEYFRLPGETYARGLGNLAIPGVKTLNTAAQLSLQAAAIAMLGIYTAVDDGVFNPDTARIEPGMFWKVARNAGPQGGSVQRFPDPRIDLTNIVLNDLRTGTQATLMDEALPPMTGAVRSPTEILERVRRLAQDHQGAFGRLVTSIVVQAVRRVIEIGYDKGYFEFAPPIDQLLVRVQITSPMALARMAAKVQRITQWIEIAKLVLEDKVDLAVKRVDAVLQIREALGIDPSLSPSADERKEIQAKLDQLAMAAAMAQAGMQGAAAGAADPFSAANAEQPPEVAA